MTYVVPHFINGQTINSETRKLNIYNPAIGELTGHLHVADQAIIDKTVKIARQAFEKWSRVPPPQRAKFFFKFKTLLENNLKPLAELITREHGKTLLEAEGSIQRGIEVVNFACDIPNHLKGSFAEEVTSGMDCYSLHQPVGVCIGITPFNFPAMVPLWMFSMAIACGNTFILKPSEKDPSCSIELAKLALEAGLPEGVLNVLQGDKETVDALITHPGVQAVSFVGSSNVAEQIYKTSIMHNKRVQAFGGAKNHCVVMPDANLEQAADAIVPSAYGSAGERCMAISVVVAVGDSIADSLVEKIKKRIGQIKINSGLIDQTDMGPLVTKEHLEKVKSYIEIGKNEGATLAMDGSHFQSKAYPKGFYMGACLFDHVKPTMRIYREEIFGPILVLVRVPDFESALKLINEHEYGNGTAIFTRDGFTARTFAERVQVGMVGINVPVPVPVAYQSFGGWKRSVFADIGMYGSEAVRFYTKLKTVTQRWYPGENK